MARGKGEWRKEGMLYMFIEHLLWARHVPGLLYISSYLIPTILQSGWTIPVLQMKKLRHREMTLPKGAQVTTNRVLVTAESGRTH